MTDGDARKPEGQVPRSWWGKFIGWTLGPLYYWGDLFDGHRRPNYGKVMAAIVLLVVLVLDVRIGIHVFSSAGDADGSHATELWAFIVLTTLLVFASHGLAGLKVWATTRGGGTVDAASQVTQAAITARRELTGGDHEATP